MNQIYLHVPINFVLPEWYATASTEMVGDALMLAASIIPYATRELTAQNTRVEDARYNGMQEAIQMAVATMRTGIETETRSEVLTLKDKIVAQEKINGEMINKVLAARQEERDSFERRKEDEIKRIKDSAEELMKVTKQRSDEAIARRDVLQAQVSVLESNCRTLEQECAILKTPSGRGLAGEANVAEVLRSAGYRVYDTSTGALKDKFLDVLAVLPEEQEDEDSGDEAPPKRGLRLAIEVKNRQTIASRDINAFEAKVKKGVANGLFDGGLFISLRTWLPGKQCLRSTLVDDSSGRPLIPIALIGTERRASSPLMAEQLEVMIHTQFDVIRQTKNARAKVEGDAPLTETDADMIRSMLDSHTQSTAEIFSEFSKQETLLGNLKKSLDAMRVKVLLQHRRMSKVRTQVSWLASEGSALPWERYYEHALRLAAQEQKLVWSNVTNRECVINAIGREAAAAAINQELKEASESKRQKTES